MGAGCLTSLTGCSSVVPRVGSLKVVARAPRQCAWHWLRKGFRLQERGREYTGWGCAGPGSWGPIQPIPCSGDLRAVVIRPVTTSPTFPHGDFQEESSATVGERHIQNDNAVWRQGHDRLGPGLGSARPCCVNCGHGTVSPCLGFHIEQKMPVTPGAAERVTIRTHTALMATPGTGGCDAGAEGCFWSPGASRPLSGICLNGSHGAALDSVNWPLV